ncbi:MAG: hypothetical protein ACK5Y2_13325, partial [Bdellovibrionales bacterium]
IERVKRPAASEQYDWFKVVISEGKNRQIRQMFEKIGYDVLKLQRISIGRLKLGALPRGEWTELKEDQIKKIFLPDLPEELIGPKPQGQQPKAAKTSGPSPKAKRKISDKRNFSSGPRKQPRAFTESED